MKDKTKNKLTSGEYWEWRTTISEMNTAEEKLKNADLALKILYRDAEILALRTKLHQEVIIQKFKDKYNKAKDEYSRYKGVLEGRLGYSLNNKLIDDITYEIADLPVASTINKE